MAWLTSAVLLASLLAFMASSWPETFTQQQQQHGKANKPVASASALRVGTASGTRPPRASVTAPAQASSHGHTAQGPGVSVSMANAVVKSWGMGQWVNSSVHAERLNADFPALSNTADPYEWVPYGQATNPHPLLPYNMTHFCHLLNGRDVLMAGDSLDGQFHTTIQFFARKWDAEGSIVRRDQNTTILWDAHICHAGHRRPIAVPLLNNFLLTPGPQREYGWATITELASGALSRGLRPGVFILNRGAHYTDDKNLLASADRALRAVYRLLPNVTVIWRNTPTGHANCSLLTAPMSSPQPAVGLPRNWDKFPAQNALVERFLREHYPQVIYLDVAAPTRLRGDMHQNPVGDADCLHYSYSRESTPIFHWLRLLYNVLNLLGGLP